MAKKVWLGAQTAYNNLTSRPIDDEFFTTTDETFTFNYEDVGDAAAINALSIDDIITINSYGECTPNAAFFGDTHTISKVYPVLNKLYRGSTGTCYEAYKFQYTDDGDPSSYADVRAGSWRKIGYTTKTPETSGIKHRHLVNSLPNVTSMSDSEIRSFLNGDYKNVLLIQIGDSTNAQELVDVQTISNANRNKYFY